MNTRIPVNPGTVEWSGENPGIYLRDTADGPWTGLGIFFRVVLSPHGRGHTMIVLDEPDAAAGFPDAANICITDNKRMTKYLIEGFMSRFPSFKGKAALTGMSWHTLLSVRTEGDLEKQYSEIVTADGIEAVMTWKDMGEPFPVEVTPETSATRAHDMYSVFFEAKDASISVNGTPLRGRVSDRQFFGKTMSTAFLALSETWVTPAQGG